MAGNTKKGKTAYQLEKDKKRELAEDTEYLRQVDRTGGEKFVQQWEDAGLKERKRRIADKQTDLEGRKGRFSYLDKLALHCQKKLGEIDFPDGWNFDAIVTRGKRIRIYGKWMDTQEGIVVVVRDPHGRVLYRAVRVAYDPMIDVKNMDILAEQAENTLDSYKGLLLSDKKDPVTGLKKTESGIILPK